MFENPFDYYTDPNFWALYLSVTLLLFLSIGFIAYTLTIRVANNSRKKKASHRSDAFADKIYAYLTGDLELESIQKEVTSSQDIPILVKVAKRLKSQLEGKDSEKLSELLSIPEVQSRYYEQLKSIREEELIGALLYFREVGEIKEEYYSKLMEWVKEGEDYLAHAAGSVLLSCNASDLHPEVLETMSMRIGDNYRTLIELLWDYWINEYQNHDEKLSVLKKILHNDEIPSRVHALIIQSMAEFGYSKTGSIIKKLLHEIEDRGDIKDCKEMVVALIDSLRRLDYIDAVSTINNILGSGIRDVEIACVKALAYFKTEEAILSLQKVAENGRDYLLQELSFQMYKHSELEDRIEVPAKTFRELNPNYTPLSLVKQRRRECHH